MKNKELIDKLKQTCSILDKESRKYTQEDEICTRNMLTSLCIKIANNSGDYLLATEYL